MPGSWNAGVFGIGETVVQKSSAEGRRLSSCLKNLVFGAAASLFAAQAFAAPDADTILKRAFDNLRGDTSLATASMTIHRPDWERQVTIKSWTRGKTDSLARSIAPPIDAGNATLELDQNIWSFDPKLNQVIKLPASMMAQAWMGSDFSYDDLAKSEDVLTDYTHRVIGTETTGGHTVTAIEADPKPGAPVVWGKIVLKVRDDYVIAEETYFDQDMKPARKLVTEKIGALSGRPYPLVMTMYPQDKPGQWTRLENRDVQFNVAMPGYVFTLSNLQNPRERAQ